MRFIKSKFFIAVLIVALSMIIVPVILASMGLGDTIRSGVATVLKPGQKLFGFIADGVAGYTEYFTKYDKLVEENAELRSRLAAMQNEVYDAKELEQMNDWLYDYLELKREHMDFSLTDAAVTGRQSANYMSVLMIDRGTSSGVQKDMPVITDDGVVGYVARAGVSWAKVVTICEAASSVGAVVDRTGEAGLISGSYQLAADSLLRMTYLAADSDIAVGDRIVTSGYGNVYPRGLIIGYVESVENDPNTQSVTATVKLAARLDELDRVMVVTGYEITEQ